MVETVVWLWTGLIALGLGRLYTSRVLGAECEEQALYSFGSGYGLLVLGMITLGFAQLYYSSVAWGVLIALTAGLAIRFRCDLFALPKRIRSVWSNFSASPFEQFCFLMIILICGRNYLGALTPEMRHDVLDYHINFPNLYTIHHGMYETPWHVFSYMPSNVESLYSLALLLSSDILAKLIHYGFSLLCTWCIYAFGRRYLGRPTASWATLLWLLIPQVTYLTSTAYIDLGVSMWEFLAIGCLLRYLESLGAIRAVEGNPQPVGSREANRWLALCGLFSGWALGAKYTVALLYHVPLTASLLTLGLLPRRVKGVSYTTAQALRAVLVISLLSLLLVSPWLLRNFIWTGNPVYPFFNRTLGLRTVEQTAAEQFIRDHAPYFPDARSVFEHLSRKINHLAIDGTLVINLALVLIPLILLRWISRRIGGPRLIVTDMPRPRRESMRASSQRFLYLFMVLFFTLVYVSWVVGTGNLDGRFMLPAYLVLCLLLATGYQVVADWFASMTTSGRFRWGLPLVISLALGVSYLYHLTFFYRDLGESPWPVLSKQRQEMYLRRKFSNLDLIKYVNKDLPPRALIAGIGYPAKRPYISHIKYGFHPILSRLGLTEHSYSVEQLHWALRQEGVTHIVAPGALGIPSTIAEQLPEAGFEPLFRGNNAILYKVPSEVTRDGHKTTSGDLSANGQDPESHGKR